ncbi:hypothetical protein [Sphingomonas crocodyli]|uniref:Uncharacterized protein n=1 Tax=Sphingomonas crocodyli TaxID=1979270 RepID=A0A437LY77_9SPHN|nr:hypothetical protein [Sphingomonas crocodyli]RVT90389.1 hypothetical protein EOD43_19180 [Sphingomonas crocodyli]
MKYLVISALVMLTACEKSSTGIDENPSTAVGADRLVNAATPGNSIGGVDQQPVGSTASGPGAVTSGPPGSGQGTGGADGGRTLGNQ